MSDIPPYVKFFAEDFYRSETVRMMTGHERRIYLDLLMMSWIDDECSIPADDALLGRLLSDPQGWLEARASVLPNFVAHPDVDGRLINPRLFEERQEFDKSRKKAREDGKMGGLKSARRRKRKATLKGGSSHPQGGVKPPSSHPQGSGNQRERESESKNTDLSAANAASPPQAGVESRLTTQGPRATISTDDPGDLPQPNPGPTDPTPPGDSGTVDPEARPRPVAAPGLPDHGGGVPDAALDGDLASGGDPEHDPHTGLIREIIALYNEALGGGTLPPSRYGRKLAASIRSRIREDAAARDLKHWREFFQIVINSPFLHGQNDRGWTASLPWLVLPTNYEKVWNGAYLKDKYHGLDAKGRRTAHAIEQAKRELFPEGEGA